MMMIKLMDKVNIVLVCGVDGLEHIQFIYKKDMKYIQ